jgi:hypothetical protein
MPVTINGTTGITTPAENTAALTVGSITGILKATSGVVAQAVAGSDYGQLTLATAQTASGADVIFTGIPNWVKRVTIIYSDITTSGISPFLFRIGSGSIQISGYQGSAGYVANGNLTNVAAFTSGCGSNYGVGSSASIYNGIVTINLLSSNKYVFSGVGSLDGGATLQYASRVTLGGVLDRVSVSTQGASTFTGGTINISYEG